MASSGNGQWAENGSKRTTFDVAYDAARQNVADPLRLAAVEATGLLDSDIEESFDRLTRLAVRLLDVPAAFVCLVDADRDFYKSACGFVEPLASARQTSGPTFSHFTIQSTKPLVISDTAADRIFRNVPTDQSLGAAAYVGIPILSDGQIIGAFCAIDSVPHAWNQVEVDALEELAAVAATEISLRVALANLEIARADAVSANRTKSEFLASMSHDLRTPLNAIGGYAQLIEMGLQGPTTEEQRISAAKILRAQRHLLTLVNDILEFAKIESGQVPLVTGSISMPELCSSLESLIGPPAAAKSIEFRCGLNDQSAKQWSTVADFERVLQILVNVSTNAINHTEAGGHVTVTGHSARSWTELSVHDTGRGIAPENIDRIFEPFFQVRDTLIAREGLGLGLAASRNLARQMGGDISVESALGAGSTFTLRLPATPIQ